MSIGNYSQLQTAIANFIDDSSLTDRIVEFIDIAEGKINRKLTGLNQHKLATATYSTSSTNRNIALPAGYLEMISLVIKKAGDDDKEYETVRFVSPDMINEYYKSAGKPDFFTVRDQIEFNCDADQSYTLRMGFIKGLDIATDSTNWLLTNYPDVYLYGSLVEASVYLMEDNRAPMWKSMFDEGIREVNELMDRTRDDVEMSVSELSSMSTRSGYNILVDR